jgi:hypothetical protein
MNCRPKNVWPNGPARVVLLLALLAATGCQPAGPVVGQVSGTVRLKGEVLKSDDAVTLTVLFIARDTTQLTALVGRDGQYTADDVPPGPVKIAVIGLPRVPQGLYAPGTKPPPLDQTHQSLLKRLERYQDPDKSGLTYSVVKGNQSYDIRLGE